jgi:hypothetical protein
MSRYTFVLVTVFLGFLSTTANAVPILCKTASNNHMKVDGVSACVDAGLGNINGNPKTDVFLTSGGTAAGYVGAGVHSSFTQTGNTGTWTIASSVDAIGFKFGTGNTADEWFIYDLLPGVTTGSWEFVLCPTCNGGGLSHMVTYNLAPAILGVMGIGLMGMVFSSGLRRRKIS